MKYSQKDKDEARNTLLSLLPPGTTVYLKLNHVSRSGMMRSITPYVIVDNEPRYIAHSVCILFDQKRDAYDGVRMDGCGMDMGFALVYNLSSMLYPEGFKCIGKGSPEDRGSRCPSNEHSNGDRDYSPHHHGSGGYALRHSWL